MDIILAKIRSHPVPPPPSTKVIDTKLVSNKKRNDQTQRDGKLKKRMKAVTPKPTPNFESPGQIVCNEAGVFEVAGEEMEGDKENGSAGREQPFVYLSALLNASDALDCVKVVRIKAFVASVREFNFEFRIEFNLQVVIDDGTGSINARVANEVAQELFGISSEGLSQLDEEARAEKLAAMEKVLATTAGLMTVQLDLDPVEPLILSIEPFLAAQVHRPMTACRFHACSLPRV